MRLTEKMAAAGADAALVVTPCFYKGKMDRRALVQHFTKVGWQTYGKTNTGWEAGTLKAALLEQTRSD